MFLNRRETGMEGLAFDNAAGKFKNESYSGRK
jgi:hypothetical protein